MKTTLVTLLTCATAMSAAAQSNVIDYRFDEVKRKVTLESQNHEVQAAVGLKAQSGDKVQTGWFSYALIATEAHKAKFEIFSSTKVALSSNEPGVILSLERGKLHAIFDKITGNEPRVVKTPGALLAVRGTQYTVEVDADGNTKLDVHEGIVEISSPLRPEPVFVHAGEFANYSRRVAPVAKPMPQRGNRAPNDGHGEKPHGSDGPKDGHPHDMPSPPSHGGGGGHGAPPPSSNPPPPPPPPRPPQA
ncbi:MAG: hypothetical protein DMF56_24825 [Acidobacteria bacterium]|nr:MAG: hypothetical protein DMF56_24825 [Acidobacteriota bacterium]